MTAVTEAIEAAGIVELQRKLPTLQAEIEGMERALISKVFKALEDRALSPDQAMYAWMELYNLRHLSRRLVTRAKVGEGLVDKVVTRGSVPQNGGN